MSPDPFTGRTFTTQPQRRSRLTAAAASLLADRKDLRVLDLGCGSGGQLLDLLTAFPTANGVGVDLSGPNIAAAHDAASGHPAADRVEFRHEDYLTLDAGQFDAVVSDSVLQFLPGDAATVLGKIATDLRPGGLLIATLPMDCGYNRRLAAVRRASIRARRPLLDRAAFAAARLLHPRWDPDLLRQRIEYLYIVPGMYGGDELKRVAEDAGLIWEQWHPVEHVSKAQMKHGMLVARRAA